MQPSHAIYFRDGSSPVHRRKLFGWSRYGEMPRQLFIKLRPDGLTYERLADASDDFHTAWHAVHEILAGAAEPLTRHAIRGTWPYDTALWRWFDRAADLDLACRVGKGTKTEPYRYVPLR